MHIKITAILAGGRSRGGVAGIALATALGVRAIPDLCRMWTFEPGPYAERNKHLADVTQQAYQTAIATGHDVRVITNHPLVVRRLRDAGKVVYFRRGDGIDSPDKLACRLACRALGARFGPASEVNDEAARG